MNHEFSFFKLLQMNYNNCIRIFPNFIFILCNQQSTFSPSLRFMKRNREGDEKAGVKLKLVRVANRGLEQECKSEDPPVTIFAQAPEDAVQTILRLVDNGMGFKLVFTAEVTSSALSNKAPGRKSAYKLFEGTLEACLPVLERHGYKKPITLRYAWLKNYDHRYSRGNLPVQLLRGYPKLRFHMIECAYDGLNSSLPDNIINPEDMEDCEASPLTPSASSYPDDPMRSDYYTHRIRSPPLDLWELDSDDGVSGPGYELQAASLSSSHVTDGQSPRPPSYSPIRPYPYTHDRPDFEAESPSYEPGYDSASSFCPTTP